jgi:O-antigen/teichoic acid export membrane protein
MYKIFREIHIDFSLVKTRFRFMMNSYLLDLSRSFNVTIDKLIVAPLLGLTMLGNYQLAIQILSVTGMFPVILFQYLLPQDASGNSNVTLKKISIFVSMILTILAIVLAPVLLPVLFPKYQDAITVVQITSLNIIPSTITLSYVSKFFGIEKNRIVLIGSLIYLSIEVPATILLGKSYGVNGVGVAMVLATSLECIYLVLVNRYISR